MGERQVVVQNSGGQGCTSERKMQEDSFKDCEADVRAGGMEERRRQMEYLVEREGESLAMVGRRVPLTIV